MTQTLRMILACLGAALFGGAAAGCSGTPTAPQSVASFGSRGVLGLSPEHIIRVMRQAGFTDAQIIEFGPALRNSLATAGGARVRVNKKVEAAFAVEHDLLYVASRRRGSFIYDPRESESPAPLVGGPAVEPGIDAGDAAGASRQAVADAGSEPGEPVTPIEVVEPGEAAIAEPMDIIAKVSGNRLPIPGPQLSILDADDFDSLGLAGRGLYPDFATQSVLLLSLGEQPTAGYWADITRVARIGDRYRVFGTAFRPAPDVAAAEQVTYPFCAVVVDKIPADAILLSSIDSR